MRKFPDLHLHYDDEYEMHAHGAKPARTAATELQTMCRRALTRTLHVAQAQHALERLVRAAVTMQTAWRACVARARSAAKRAHARLIAHARMQHAWRMWHSLKTRQARVHAAVVGLQSAVRRVLAAPRLRIGARVRLTAAALVVDDDEYDWSEDALTEHIYGTLRSFGRHGTAVIESDDARREDTPYALRDLEPIVDGDSAAARASAVDLDDSDEFFDAPADAGLHGANGAPAFTVGGVRR